MGIRKKIIYMILVMFCLHLTAFSQNISMKLSKVTVKEAMEALKQENGYSFVFASGDVDTQKEISVAVKNQPVSEAVRQILQGQNISYEINGKNIIIKKITVTNNQKNRKINGTITDQHGSPVIGANVVEKGTTNGSVTDVEGHFTIHVPEEATLQISYIGYMREEVKLKRGENNLNITLREDSKALEEVIVIGYGTQKKVHLTGAVNTVSSKEIENRPVKSAVAALQGLAPNLNITVTSGSSNHVPRINVRGYESINSSNNALILVDNVPVDAATFSRINPSDIENISLLKDAASAAVYGARAAFGVILVTTKTAKSDKLEVSADFNLALRHLIGMSKMDLNLVNCFETINAADGSSWATAEQIEYARRRMEDPSLPAVLYPDIKQGLGRWGYYGLTDWQDIFTKEVAPTYTANVSIRQRTDKLDYSLSGGLFREKSLWLNEDPFNRFNFRGTGNYQLTKWWKLGSSISFARTTYNSSIGSDSDYNAYRGCYLFGVIYNPDGTRGREANRYWDTMEGGRYIQKINETSLTFNTQVDVLKDILTLKGDVTFRMYDEEGDNYELPYYRSTNPLSELERQNSPKAQVWTTRSNYTVLNFYGNFNKTFADKHNVYAMVGFNQEYYHYNRQDASRKDLITNNLPTINLATGEMSMSENDQTYTIRGLFGRLGYIFDGKYIVEGNGRYDGTSKFSKENRFGFFPSITGGWIISEEKFVKPLLNTLKVDFLKIRASYGDLGNQSVQGNYPYLATMGRGQISYFLNDNRPIAIYAPGSSPASDLTWERVHSFNVGVDLNLLDNRLNLSFDKYTRYTTGMLTQILELPAVYGVSSPASNAADLKTKGFELTVGYHDQINVGGSPLSFKLNVLLADSRAWITKYKNENKILTSWREGQEIGEIWGYESLGFFTKDDFEDPATGKLKKGIPNQSKICDFTIQPGDLKYKDLNDDGEISNGENKETAPGDRKIIGNDRARLPYSIELVADWKGFDLRAFFQGIGKRDWYPNTGWFWSNYDGPWQTPSLYIRDRWKASEDDPYSPQDPNAYYPRLRDKNGYFVDNANTQYLQNASYLRLKNLTIGYTLPTLLTKKWGIDRLRFYLSGENLWTLNHIHIKDIDPELISGNPLQRVFSCGFNLNF